VIADPLSHPPPGDQHVTLGQPSRTQIAAAHNVRWSSSTAFRNT
jgi:hypothetical protein